MVALTTRVDAADSLTISVPSCRRVLIVNYSGYILGDDAIFEALLSIVYQAYGSHVAIDAFTAMPQRTMHRYPFVGQVEHLYTYLASAESRARAIGMIQRADVILVGGGDIVEGQRSLLILACLARMMGVPLSYVGVGVLMPGSRRRQRMLRWTMNQANLVATRDAESTGLLQGIGVHKPTLITLPDLAIALDASLSPTTEQILSAEGIRIRSPYIVVNLRSPSPHQYDKTWGSAEYEAIAHVCRSLIDHHGYSVLCVPMVTSVALSLLAHERSDDEVMLDLQQRIDRPGHVHVLHADYRPGEVARIVQDAHLALGIRLHFLVLAAIGGVPLIALSYARKVDAFMHSTGLEYYCLDATGVTIEKLEECIGHAQTNHNAIKKQLYAWHHESKTSIRTLEPMLVSLLSKSTKQPIVRRRPALRLAHLLISVVILYDWLRSTLR